MSTLAAATTPVTVWMAGDSTMQNGTNCPVGWCAQLRSYFTGSVTVNNSAVGGRSIQTWLYDPNVTSTKNAAGECVINPATYSTRWQAMLNSSTGMKAGDYLFVQFGINDGSSTCPRHVGSARFKELLGMMVTAALDRGAHPVLVTPVAAITCSGSTAVGNRGFVTETKAVAASRGVPVIDLNALSVQLYNSLKLCPNNSDYTSGAVGAFFCNDHTHFEAAGARQIAGLVASALRDQGIGLAAYLNTDPVTTTSPTSTTSPTTTTSTTTTSRTTTTTTQPPTTTTSSGSGGRTCTASYTVASSWPGGFVADVKVTAGSSAITGWRVTMTLPSGAAISNMWNGITSGTSGTVTVNNQNYNGSLGAGQATSFGFQGTGSGSGATVSCTAG